MTQAPTPSERSLRNNVRASDDFGKPVLMETVPQAQASDEDRGLEPIGTYAARVLLEAFRDDECTSVSQALDPLFDILEARDAAVRLQQRKHDARAITQLTKERDLALERVGVLEGVLTKCKDTFWHYQSLHAAKVPADTVKARANGDMARMCEAALTTTTGTELG